ncbi:NAD-dependent epimerase/dehydratase family protein, partial [Patescibacteria group bacterium]
LRLANVYGPRQDPEGEAGVIAIFVKALLEGKPLTVFGDGKQTRDYIYVGDVVSACTAVIPKLKKGVSGVYNIGTGKETSVNGLVAMIEQVVGKAAKVKYGPAVVGEVRRSAILARKFKRGYKWTPAVNLEEGIQKTVDWFKLG